jgi:glucosamine--fructose-6-phosphate aminotransferase (isomerizing)
MTNEKRDPRANEFLGDENTDVPSAVSSPVDSDDDSGGLGSNAKRELREGCSAVERVLDASDDLESLRTAVESASRIYLTSCGSSHWAGVMASRLLSRAGYEARPMYASEFIFGDPPLDGDTLVVGLSQSGETTETVHAIERARERGAQTGAITNTAGSRLDDLAGNSFATPVGDERAVLATKSVDAAVVTAYLLAGTSPDVLRRSAEECRRTLETSLVDAVAALSTTNRAYALGVGPAYGLAGEAATKFGEGPLVQTTALPATEINHGPIANARGTPVFLFATHAPANHVYDGVVDDLSAAGARPFVVHHGNVDVDSTVPAVELPGDGETVLPALKFVQRLAVEAALERGNDPDSPPSLSKHVERSDLD